MPFFWYNAEYSVGTLVVTKGTEGVLRINPVHVAKTLSNHHIDLLESDGELGSVLCAPHAHPC